MSAREVIARHLYGQLFDSDWEGAGEGAKNHALSQADGILQALAASTTAAVVELPTHEQVAALNVEYEAGVGCECCYESCPGWVKDLDTEIDYSPSEAQEHGLALYAAGLSATQRGEGR